MRIVAALHFSAKTADLRAFFETAGEYDRRMPLNEFPVFVLGTGALAAAVRVQLRASTSSSLASLRKNTFSSATALFIACSDFENAFLRASLARRAANDGVQILFASLAGRTLRVGPFMSSVGFGKPTPSYLTRSWDFSRMTSDESSVVAARSGAFVAPQVPLSPQVDTSVARVAQIGASLIVRELANILRARADLGSGTCVAEIDAPADPGQWSPPRLPPLGGCTRIPAPLEPPTLFGDARSGLHDEAFVVAGIECRVAKVKPLRGWHPATID